jgi:hypothetical protein
MCTRGGRRRGKREKEKNSAIRMTGTKEEGRTNGQGEGARREGRYRCQRRRT